VRGTLTAPAGTFSAASHRPSTLRSPAFASSMIFLAIISSVSEIGGAVDSRASRFESYAHETSGLRVEGLAA